MNCRPILLIGGGGHCRACIDVIELQGLYAVAGVVERAGAERPESVLGYPIVGTDDDLPSLRNRFAHALVTVGQVKTPAIRIGIYERLRALGFELPPIVSPRAYVSHHAVVGAGTIVMHDALVNAGASIGDNCIINSKALVEHDATIGSHCHISTGAIINGGVRVGAGTFFGSNAVSVHGISILEGRFVRAGSLERGK